MSELVQSRSSIGCFGANDAANSEWIPSGAPLPEAEGGQPVAFDVALNALAAMDPGRGQIAGLRFFRGLGVEETADVLKISLQTVQQDWKLAGAWLLRESGEGKCDQA